MIREREREREKRNKFSILFLCVRILGVLNEL
jgi:hypothetical protein